MAPLLQLSGLGRVFTTGDQDVTVLDGIDLDIAAGEMVAIIGASGSGKSTLMNILGCLDRPSSGHYRVAGKATDQLSPDELAALRRHHFGFIFQRYHLLNDLSALGNVEVPAIYAGSIGAERRDRATRLLRRLGLGERLEHRPGQLSGGQQQRVSIARALMNGGEVILADEPTGALDRSSGEEVMKILRELHAGGKTVILVTHDQAVADVADRVIRIADGHIVSDQRSAPTPTNGSPGGNPVATAGTALIARMTSAARMALLAMRAHKLRALLSMLGIIIGVASVISVVAIGEGSRAKVLAGISDLGTSTIEYWIGRGWGDPDSKRLPGLKPSDVEALATEPYLVGASPVIETSLTLRRRDKEASATLSAVNEQYFTIKGLALSAGTGFDREAVRRLSQVIVIDQRTRETLFGAAEDPIGQVILVGTLPMRVIGVAAPAPVSPFMQGLAVYAPHTTVMSRITGRSEFRSLIVRVRDGVSAAAAEAASSRLLSVRRGTTDFQVENSDAIRQKIEATAATLSRLISSIALISLVVGGIGVMNIMLVSVTERTSEVGIRMALGARRSDILAQFLIEAIFVCLIGGVLGVVAAFGFGAVFAHISQEFQMIHSPKAVALALLSASAIGLIFGYLPARNAARLDPVRALSRE